MRFWLMILVIFASTSASAVEITHFRSGLACASGWICQPTQEILITDQSTCVFNGKETPCTWVGFEFDYTDAPKGAKLQCVSETSVPADSGNPSKLIASDSTSENFEVELPAGNGHFFNPQYFTFVTRPADKSIVVNTAHCAFEGKILFEYRYNLHFATALRD